MKQIYLDVFKRDGYKCRHCNNRTGLHPHHIIYRSQQGIDDMRNIITLCWQCHLQGIHQHNLEINILTVLEDDVIVEFIRLNGWVPI